MNIQDIFPSKENLKKLLNEDWDAPLRVPEMTDEDIDEMKRDAQTEREAYRNAN